MRPIDADALIDRMYHDAFETDTDMQKWDSGCWIRYKMFENAIDETPTIDVVPKDFHDKTCEAIAKKHTEEIQRLTPKRGGWIYVTVELGLRTGRGYGHHCSECDAINRSGSSNFCPNCGADMREQKLKFADEDTTFGGLMSAT